MTPATQTTLNPLVLAAEGGVGYLATALFTSGNPLAGAVYGVTYGATHFVVSRFCDWIGLTDCSKIVDTAAKILASVGAALAITLAVGFNVTVPMGMVLAVAMVVTHMMMNELVLDCISCEKAPATKLKGG